MGHLWEGAENCLQVCSGRWLGVTGGRELGTVGGSLVEVGQSETVGRSQVVGSRVAGGRGSGSVGRSQVRRCQEMLISIGMHERKWG